MDLENNEFEPIPSTFNVFNRPGSSRQILPMPTEEEVANPSGTQQTGDVLSEISNLVSKNISFH